MIASIAGPRRLLWDSTVFVKEACPTGASDTAMYIEQGNPQHKVDRIFLTVDQAEALFVTLDAWLVSKGR